MSRIWWLFGCLFLAGSVLAAGHFAGASEPTEMPKPNHFVEVEIAYPRHGAVYSTAPDQIRITLAQPGGSVPASLKLHVALDGKRLDRIGQFSRDPIETAVGESEITIPVPQLINGVHSVETYTTDFVPFSNRVVVKFGINSMIHQQPK